MIKLHSRSSFGKESTHYIRRSGKKESRNGESHDQHGKGHGRAVDRRATKTTSAAAEKRVLSSHDREPSCLKGAAALLAGSIRPPWRLRARSWTPPSSPFCPPEMLFHASLVERICSRDSRA